MHTIHIRVFIASFLLLILTGNTYAAHVFAHQTSTSRQIQTGVGPTRQFSRDAARTGSSVVYSFTFYSDSAGAYVSARLDHRNAPLEVKASAIGAWETFTEIYNADGSVSFQAANGNYLSARLSKTDAPLEATALSIGPWERFNVVYLNKQTPLEAFRAANGNYISARIGTTGTPLEAEAPSIGPWEAFIAY